MLSSVRVRHAAPGEEHDTARGASGGGAKGGGDGGCDAEGGDGGSADREPGAQTPSNVTDPTFLSHSESRAKGRVVQLQSFAPVHVPQPVSHASLTVRSSALNACSPIARSPSSYSTVNIAKSDCANPCFATAVQPAVMTAHPPGMTGVGEKSPRLVCRHHSANACLDNLPCPNGSQRPLTWDWTGPLGFGLKPFGGEMVAQDLSQNRQLVTKTAAAQVRAAATPNPVSRSSRSAEREQRLESIAVWR
eukprot:scaffold35192_cov64-Phaeocystis_antarctica.AAC.3